MTAGRALAAGGAVALLDGAFAVTLCYLYAATCVPVRVFQGIAAGVLGREPALAGGAASAALGVGLHVLIATSWAALYGVAYERAAGLRRLTASVPGLAAAAVAYGMLVWLTMSLVVTPLSFARPTPPFSQVWWVVLAGHPFVVGLPIVALVRHPREVA